MFDNQQAGLVKTADERSRANVFSGVSRDLQWTVEDYLNPSHPQQAVTQAVDATILLDPELCGPPEQLAGTLQMPLDEARSMNRDHWERMGFAHSDNRLATISSTDSLERKTFWESVQAVNQPKSPGDEVRRAHISTYGDHIPRSTSQLCQIPSQPQPSGLPPQLGHTSDNIRVGGSHRVLNESWYGYASLTDDHHVSSFPYPAMEYSSPLQCPPRSLRRSPGRESPASEDMNTEGKPSYVLQSPEILQVLDPTPTIQGSAPSLSVARSPSGEEEENIVQPTQGSGDSQVVTNLEYRYDLRRLPSRPARRKSYPKGGRSLSSRPQPIHKSTAILPLPHREEDSGAYLPQSGRRKRKVEVLGSKRHP